MERVTRAVEAMVTSELPDCFGLIFDGWSHASEHYLAVVACYQLDRMRKTPLLSMAPLINEPNDHHSAAIHLAFIEGMLARDYSRTTEQCLFLAGDNADERPIGGICQSPPESCRLRPHAEARGRLGDGASSDVQAEDTEPVGQTTVSTRVFVLLVYCPTFYFFSGRSYAVLILAIFGFLLG